MGNNIYLTTNNYQEEAKTLAETTGGLVLTLGSTSIGDKDENIDLWTYKVTLWKCNEEYELSNSYSDVESDLLKTNAIAYSDFLPIGTYAAILTNNHHCMSEATVLSSTAEILRAYGNYVVVLSSSTRTNGSTSTAQNGQGATSAVVKSIEKELGVNLEVDSDSELHSILQKSGAGPLSGLLKKAYGTEKKKTEVKR